MKINRIAFLLISILFIFTVFPFQFMWNTAKAEGYKTISDGTYQVELSFLPLEFIEQKAIFNEEATLLVREGTYTLAMLLNHDNVLSIDTVNQLNENISFLVNRTENLVQVDLNDLQQSFEVKGTFKLLDEPIQFLQQITIEKNSLPVTEEDLPPIIVPDVEIEKPKPSKPVIEVKPKVLLNYLLLTDGTDKASIMNTYVDPVVELIKKEDKNFAEMKILKSSWIKGLTIDFRDKMIEPKTISLVDDIRVIQFQVENLKKNIRMWVKVDIPDIGYHHQYYVQLQFDKKQVDKFLGESVQAEKPPVNKPPVKIDKINSPEPQITKSPPLPEKPSLQLAETPVSTNVKKEGVPKRGVPEESIAFDRSLDEVLNDNKITVESEINKNQEVKLDKTATTSQIAPLDKIKIGLLSIASLLSGILLVRRIKNAKKSRFNE